MRTLSRAMRRERRAMRMASGSRSRRSTVMTTSAASELAVAPRAPMATPTSALARAGASLMPSPTMTRMPSASRFSPIDGVDLVGRGALREHAVHADGRGHQVRHAVVVAGDHDDAPDAHAAQRADDPRRLGADRVVQHERTDEHAVGGHVDARGALQADAPAHVAGPRWQRRAAARELGRARPAP